jgi:hypothetical protein
MPTGHQVPMDPRGSAIISLREFLEQQIQDNDRLYDTRFRAGEIAVNAALAAQKELTNAAFAASEKAIVKAEEAQKDYNQRSNEFRGQLDDQAKSFITRIEISILFKAQDDRITKMEEQQAKDVSLLRAEIQGLRETRSQTVGETTAKAGVREQSNFTIGIWAVVAVGILDAIATLALLFQHK